MIGNVKILFQHEAVGKIVQTLAVRFVAILLLAVANIFIIRQLSISDNGSYNYLNSVVSVSLQVVAAGFAASIMYFSSYNQMVATKKVFLLGVCALIIFSPVLYFLIKDRQYIWILSLLFIFTGLGSYGNSFFISQKKVSVANVADLIQALIFFVFILVFFLLELCSIKAIFIVALASFFVKDMFFTARMHIFNKSNTKKAIPAQTHYEKEIYILSRATIVNILGLTVVKSGIIILGLIKGEEAVGIYSVAANVSDLFMVVPAIVGSVAFPYFAEAASAGLNSNSLKIFRYSLLMSIMLFLAFIIFGRYIIMFVGGTRYLASLTPLYILSFGVFFLSLQVTLSQEIISHRFPKEIVYVWAGGFLLCLAANFALVPRFSYIGSALATTITYAAVSIVTVILYYYYSRQAKL